MSENTEEFTMATVTANAVLTLPAGVTLGGPAENEIEMPNGDRYKFWVCVERVYIGGEGPDEYTLNELELSNRGMFLEHEGTLVTLDAVPNGQLDQPALAPQTP